MANDNPSQQVEKFLVAARRFLESFDQEELEAEDGGQPVGNTDREALIEEIDKLYTPILVANELTANLADQGGENSPRSGNVIKFDDETRKAQLISVAARLIAKYRSSADYKLYLQATKAAQAMKLKIQKDNHATAVALADEYLARLAATSNSPEASRAAQALSRVKVTLG